VAEIAIPKNAKGWDMPIDISTFPTASTITLPPGTVDLEFINKGSSAKILTVTHTVETKVYGAHNFGAPSDGDSVIDEITWMRLKPGGWTLTLTDPTPYTP
jgi:hypothetical protein